MASPITTRSAAVADHEWFGSETVKTRLGDFEFKAVIRLGTRRPS